MDDVDRPIDYFGSILTEAVQESINFDGGEKRTVSVSFENDVLILLRLGSSSLNHQCKGDMSLFPVIHLLMQKIFAPRMVYGMKFLVTA
jgi:hypothetical protein